jgi:hypothetical protein
MFIHWVNEKKENPSVVQAKPKQAKQSSTFSATI